MIYHSEVITLQKSLKRKQNNKDRKYPDVEIEKIDLSERWKKHLLSLVKKDTNESEDFDEYRIVHKAWSWITSTSDMYWIVIDLLDVLGVASVKHILGYLMLEYNLEDMDSKQYKSKENTIRSILRLFYRLNIIDCFKLEEEDLGHQKYTVTLWVSPFYKEKQKEKAKKLYILSGGIKIRKKNKITAPKSPEYVVSHNNEVKRLSKATIDSNIDVAFCEECGTEYPIGFEGEYCMNCQDNLKRLREIKVKKNKARS